MAKRERQSVLKATDQTSYSAIMKQLIAEGRKQIQAVTPNPVQLGQQVKGKIIDIEIPTLKSMEDGKEKLEFLTLFVFTFKENEVVQRATVLIPAEFRSNAGNYVGGSILVEGRKHWNSENNSVVNHLLTATMQVNEPVIGAVGEF